MSGNRERLIGEHQNPNPRPRAVCHEATGNVSTGIIEAVVTSARRKIVPLSVARVTDSCCMC